MTNTTSKPARKSTPRNTPLPAVTGTVKVLREVGTVGPCENNVGEIEITTGNVVRAYFVTVHENGYRLNGYDAKRKQETVYDINARCTECDCPDFVSRSHRRVDLSCKHCNALSALIGKGKLPEITPPACKPVVEEEDIDTDAYLDDSEADAWHSQFDAA